MVVWVNGFEDNDLSNYSGDTSHYSIQTGTVDKGTYALEFDSSGKNAITQTDTTWSAGTTLSTNVYCSSTFDSVLFLFAVQSETGYSNLDCYGVLMGGTASGIRIVRFDNGSLTYLDGSYTGDNPNGQWLRLDVTWDNSGNITATLYDSTNTQVASRSVTDTTYSSGGHGYSNFDQYSNTFYFDGDSVTPPSTPQNLSSTVSSDDITLNWDSVNWNNDQGHYNVYRKHDGGSYNDIADVSSGTTSYTDSALLDGEKYTYYVDAVNSAGSSNDSNTTSSTTALPAPSSLSASATNDDISLSWSDNSDNESGFKIERSVDGSAYSQINTVSSNTTSYSDNGLLDGEQYTYRVRAYTEHVNSSYSGGASATTILPAPSSLSASASGNDISLSWTDNSDNENGFKIYRYYNSGAWSLVADIAAGSTTYTDSNLSRDGEQYTYKVRSYTEHKSSDSGTNSATTNLPDVTGLSASVSGNDVSLSWDNVFDNPDGFYEVYYNDDRGTAINNTWVRDAELGDDNTSYTINNLYDGESYRIIVRAETPDYGQSGNAWAYPTTDLNSPDNANISLSVSGDDISVSWTDSFSNPNGEYRIYYDSDENNWDQDATVGENTTSHTINALLDGEQYNVHIYAYTPDAGEAGHGGDNYATTALPDVSGVSATVNGDDSITVTWNDNIDNGSHRVQMLRDGTNWEHHASGSSIVGHNTTSVTIQPSSDNAYNRQVGIDSEFRFRVRTETEHVNGSYDYSSYVYTTPLPPHNPSVSRPDANTFEISWTVQTDISDALYLQVREDTGSGYGSWTGYDFIQPDGSKGTRQTKQYQVGQSYYYSTTISEDSRVQFRMRSNSYDGQTTTSEWVYADYGNSGNVYFEDDFESNDLSAWDYIDQDAGTTSGSSMDSGFSSADQGTYYAYLDGNARIQKDLGDLSNESNVIVKCAMAAGSMDNSGETADLDWYDGSNWQALKRLGWEYNEQGWVEVTASVPDSWLSTNNHVRFEQDGGGGDRTYVDRVVVSDILHEYTTPAAPSGLSLNASVENEITASWTDNASFNSDYTYRSNEAGTTTWDTTIGLNGSTTSYTETGLKDGEKYDVRVYSWVRQWRRGNNPNSWTSSNLDGAATTILPAPGTPSLSVTGDDISVSWTDNTDNEDGFQVYRTHDGGSYTQVADVAAGTTSYSDTGLLDGEQYTYYVRVYTEHVNSDSGTNATTTVLPDVGQPTLDASIEDEITVSWTDVINNGEYLVEYRDSANTSWTTLGSYAETITAATATGLEDGEEYDVRMRTQTEHVTGAWTTVNTAVTVLPAPSGVALDATIEDEITVSWTNNDDSSDGTIEVYQSQDGTLGAQVLSTGTLTTTAHTEAGLTDGRTYYYTVRRSTPHTTSDSTQVSATTILPAVTSVGLDASVEDEMTVSWTKADDNGNGDFEVYRSTDGTLGSLVTTISTLTTTSYTDEGLNDGEQYHYTVSRVTNDASKNSSQPNAVTPLPAPTTLSASNITADAVDLAWTNNHDYGSITVEYKRSSNASWITFSSGLSLTTETETLTGLLDGEQYDARVLAVTEHTTTEDN